MLTIPNEIINHILSFREVNPISIIINNLIKLYVNSTGEYWYDNYYCEHTFKVWYFLYKINHKNTIL